MRNVRGLWSLRPGSVTELRPDCFQFGKWRDTVNTVCTLSNKWGGASWDQPPQVHPHPPFTKTGNTLCSTCGIHQWVSLVVYLRNKLQDKKPPRASFTTPPPSFSNGGPLYWTVKSQPLSARAYMYGSGSVHVLLHTRGHVQTAVLCFARISQTFQPALIGPDWRAHIAVQMQQGKKRKDLG